MVKRRIVGVVLGVGLILVGVAAAYELFGGDAPWTSDSGNAAGEADADGKAPQDIAPSTEAPTTVKGATDGGEPRSNGPGAKTPTTQPGTGEPGGRPGGTTVPGGTPGRPRPPTTQPTLTEPPPVEPNTPAAAYVAAYDDRCREIWSHALGDGELWDAIDDFYGPYTIDDCLDGRNPGWEQGFDTDAEAAEAGVDDANWAVENLTPNLRLKNADGYILYL